eukprot:5383570-Prymnesium_polylepis.3
MHWPPSDGGVPGSSSAVFSLASVAKEPCFRIRDGLELPSRELTEPSLLDFLFLGGEAALGGGPSTKEWRPLFTEWSRLVVCWSEGCW